MKKTLLFSAIILLVDYASFAQAPAIQWQKAYGGSNTNELNSLQQTADGGYVLGGTSNSDISGDKTEASRGSYDLWVVKIDANGIKQWDKTFGGNSNDQFSSLQQTTDGGYILGGRSSSGISGDKTEASRGFDDYWVVKIDSNGTKQWDKTFGRNGGDILSSLQQTTDGGYILGGYSNSGISSDKTEASRGSNDFWVVKINANGIKQWDKTFGGSVPELLRSLQQTADGGYILGGGSFSDDKTEASRELEDYWVVKVDSNGIKQWDRTFGGSGYDQLFSLQQTSDGSYILGGYSESGISGDKTEDSRGNGDYWVVKIDGNGIKQWDKTFGGSGDDVLRSLQQTAEGGYILGGYSESDISGDKTEDSRGGNDYWVVKIDGNGIKQWDKTLGGIGNDRLFSLQQTTDGGYIVGGGSGIGISGDRTEASQGSHDFWIVKLDNDNTGSVKKEDVSKPITLYPNPASYALTIKTLESVRIEIYSTEGKLMETATIPEKITVNLEQYPSGLFLVRIISVNGSVAYTKFIKE